MLHIITTRRSRGAHPRQAQIKPDQTYESHISPALPTILGVTSPYASKELSFDMSGL